MKQAEIYEKALAKFGRESQLLKLIEETGELQRALSRVLNYYAASTHSGEEVFDAEENLCEEIADVEIVLNQVKLTFNPEMLSFHKQRKLQRLEAMLIDLQ